MSPMLAVRTRSESIPRPRLRRGALALAAVAAALLLLVVVAFRDPTSRFHDRRSRLVQVTEKRVEMLRPFTYTAPQRKHDLSAR